MYPEEAFHIVEYGLLSYFFFRALSAKIRDRTIYITVLFFVAFVGILDEFIQWMMPQRYWDYRDVGINALAGAIFLFAVWKAVRPGIICEPVKRHSIKILAGIVTITLLFFGLCLSNTPERVKSYSSLLPSLSWLVDEETMTEFGYKHLDPEAGTFISRMTLEEIMRIDLERGEVSGKALKFETATNEDGELKNIHTPYSDRFMFEFVIHLQRRNGKLKEAEEVENPEEKNRLGIEAYAENLVLEKYFGNTLRHSGMAWADEKVKHQQEKALLGKRSYTSGMYHVITFIDLKTVWTLIPGILVLIWGPILLRKKRV